MATSSRGHGIAGIFSSVDTANMQGSLGQASHWHVLVLCMAKFRFVEKRPCPTKGSIELQLKTNTD